MTDHTQLENQRLEGELDKATRELDLVRDVIRAAQRLHDEIHLAGTTEVNVLGPVIDNKRQPGSYGFTITTHNRNLSAALKNLNDALQHYYTPGDHR